MILCHILIILCQSYHRLIAIHQTPTLKFDTENVEVFFHTFNAHYFEKNFNDEQLYFELIKCLSPDQFHKISSQFNHSVRSFILLKQALINAYTIPLHTKFNLLRSSPPLGDRTPAQLLYDMKRIIGNYDPTDATVTWFLKTEFLNRMPAHIKPILAAFESQPLDEIAKIATSIICNDNVTSRSSHVTSQDTISCLIKELNSVKLELASLRYPNMSASNNSNPPLNIISPFHSQPTNLQHDAYRATNSKQNKSRPPLGPNLSLPGRSDLYNGLCFYHHNYSSNAKYCIPGCKHHQTFSKHLNYPGGASTSNQNKPFP